MIKRNSLEEKYFVGRQFNVWSTGFQSRRWSGTCSGGRHNSNVNAQSRGHNGSVKE